MRHALRPAAAEGPLLQHGQGRRLGVSRGARARVGAAGPASSGTRASHQKPKKSTPPPNKKTEQTQSSSSSRRRLALAQNRLQEEEPRRGPTRRHPARRPETHAALGRLVARLVENASDQMLPTALRLSSQSLWTPHRDGPCPRHLCRPCLLPAGKPPCLGAWWEPCGPWWHSQGGTVLLPTTWSSRPTLQHSFRQDLPRLPEATCAPMHRLAGTWLDQWTSRPGAPTPLSPLPPPLLLPVLASCFRCPVPGRVTSSWNLGERKVRQRLRAARVLPAGTKKNSVFSISHFDFSPWPSGWLQGAPLWRT